MKPVTLIKQAVLVVSIGMAFSAHAQLLGRGGALGGSVGGMIGGAGNIGGQIGGMGSMGERGAPIGIARSAPQRIDGASAAGSVAGSAAKQASAQGSASGSGSGSGGLFGWFRGGKESAAQAAPAAQDAARGAQGSASGSGSGSANASLGLDGVGTATQGMRAVAEPVGAVVREQARTTRDYASASAANARGMAGAGKQAALSSAKSIRMDPSASVSGSASGNGAAGASGEAN